jgi:hypothetical protein
VTARRGVGGDGCVMAHGPQPWWVPAGFVVFLLLTSLAAHAQPVGLTDPCRHAKANVSGIARADITINTSPVVVIAPNPRICKALIFNTSSSQALRCAGTADGAPTAVAGVKLPPGSSLTMDLEAQEGWQCVRDTSATGSADVTVIQLEP